MSRDQHAKDSKEIQELRRTIEHLRNKLFEQARITTKAEGDSKKPAPAPESAPATPSMAWASFETNISLIVALGIAALQAMGYTVTPYIAIPCWAGVLFCLLDVIWRHSQRRKLVKVIATGLSIFAIGALSYRSVIGPEIQLAKVEVYFNDQGRLKGVEIPFRDISRVSAALQEATPKPVHVFVNSNQLINVILRNISDVDLKNAAVTMISNYPITGRTDGAHRFTPTEVYYEVRQLRPYKRLGTENDFSISIDSPVLTVPGQLLDSPPVVMIVLVEADNIKPLAVVRTFILKRQ